MLIINLNNPVVTNKDMVDFLTRFLTKINTKVVKGYIKEEEIINVTLDLINEIQRNNGELSGRVPERSNGQT